MGHTEYMRDYRKRRRAAGSIQVDRAAKEHPVVRFESFVGVAPTKYSELFTATGRKGDGGKVAQWDGRHSVPRVSGVPVAYIAQEAGEFEQLRELMIEKGLLKRPAEGDHTA